jgi:glutathione peroxidase
MSMTSSNYVHPSRAWSISFPEWRGITRALALAVAAVATMFHGDRVDGAPFFNESAVASAIAATLPASWTAPSAPGLREGIVYLDETTVRQAMAPPFPAAWTQAAGVASTAHAACPALLQHSFKLLQSGDPQSLCRYHGNVVLVVNTASQCGYTNQYEGLEALYRKYRERGLVVVGFPSNDFGGQEPGTNKEIAEFCRTNFGIQFPLYEKASVSKLSGNPLYAELAKATGQVPKWNFHKYLIDRDGKPVASFASAVTPDAREITRLIEQLLAQKPASAKG